MIKAVIFTLWEAFKVSFECHREVLTIGDKVLNFDYAVTRNS